jgi:NAD(P)-dependent dehydrogenase (short-subunit alcohol dehydrogenase family)
MSTALVTGASRGIGAEYVRQLRAKGWQVIAAMRDPQCEGAIRLDTADHNSIDALAAKLAGTPIDLLLNNAGSYGPQGFPEGQQYQAFGTTDYAVWADIMRVNLFGPMKMVEAFAPHLEASDRKLVVNMSSDLGSVENNAHGGSHAYRTSKSALNMLTRGLSIDLVSRGITVVSMAPGWTRTELGGSMAPLSVEESVEGQIAVIEGLGPKDSGRFVNLRGDDVSW